MCISSITPVISIYDWNSQSVTIDNCHFAFAGASGGQEGQVGGPAERGQEAKGEHRPAVCDRLPIPSQIPSGRDLRGLRAFRQDEGEAHHGLQGDQRQNQVGGGADPGPEGVHPIPVAMRQQVTFAGNPKKEASELKKKNTT